jgi:hypothetical protein
MDESLDAMEHELVTDSLVYCNDPDASPDGLRGYEGMFSLCTFARVDSLARAGQMDKARNTFETSAQPPGALFRGNRSDRGTDQQFPSGLHPPRADRRSPHAEQSNR